MKDHESKVDGRGVKEDIQPMLFKIYPGIRDRIGWIPLGRFPTPVEELSGSGLQNIWIKRDDISSTIYGGNKVRKLEFVLADAIRKGKDRVVTMGGIGTNHGLATAVFCKKLGIACTLILFYQPVTSYVRRNLLLFHRHGAQLVYSKGMLKAGIDFYTTLRLRHPRAYFLYAGGSTPIGTLGFVNAVFELKGQIERGEMPKPRYIVCPLGSSGTMAGLSLGCMLGGLDDVDVIGVRVAASNLGPIKIASPDVVRSLMVKTYRLLKDVSSEVPDVNLARLPRVLDGYFGKGYGYPTDEGIAAMRFMRENHGIDLDPTYTSKAFAAVLDLAKANAGGPILYWHTYNSVDLSSEAGSVDYHDLPREFHAFFEKGELPV